VKAAEVEKERLQQQGIDDITIEIRNDDDDV
jgi:hypothetical protein